MGKVGKCENTSASEESVARELAPVHLKDPDADKTDRRSGDVVEIWTETVDGLLHASEPRMKTPS